MNTKEKILHEALLLFSMKGFESVSVRELARAVGIKESSIYNHYKNKQEILDTIVDENAHRAEHIFEEHIPAVQKSGKMEFMNGDVLAELICNVFQDYFEDSHLMRFYRLLTIEQYKSETMKRLHDTFYFEAPLHCLTESFQELIGLGAFDEKFDAETMAVHFFSPIALLFDQAVGKKDEEREKKLAQVRNHVKQFCDLYYKRDRRK